jgi:hypothetical protein
VAIIASSCISTTGALGAALGQQLGGGQGHLVTALAADSSSRSCAPASVKASNRRLSMAAAGGFKCGCDGMAMVAAALELPVSEIEACYTRLSRREQLIQVDRDSQ